MSSPGSALNADSPSLSGACAPCLFAAPTS